MGSLWIPRGFLKPAGFLKTVARAIEDLLALLSVPRGIPGGIPFGFLGLPYGFPMEFPWVPETF